MLPARAKVVALSVRTTLGNFFSEPAVGGVSCEASGVPTTNTRSGPSISFVLAASLKRYSGGSYSIWIPIYVVFSDKVATREYVSRRIGSDAVVPMLWLGTDPAALPFQTLRAPYIIKCSHGSDWNIVVRDNETIDRAAIRAQLANWLAIDFGIQMTEPGYSSVPRRLLVEPLLTDRGGFPNEYSFFVFSGVARLVMLWIK